MGYLSVSRFHKKSIRGNTLVNIMVSLVLISILLAGVYQLYSSINNNAIQARRTNLLSLASGTGLLKMVNEISFAGSFGCFNSRNFVKTLTASAIESIPATIAGPGRFESSYSGLQVFTTATIPSADSSALNLQNDSLVNGSEILKIQYANRFAIITAVALNGNNLAVINFESPAYVIDNSGTLVKSAISKYGLDSNGSNNSLYILASCSHLDEIQGGLTGNTLTLTNQIIPISSHDSNSWQLMNMETRYYYLSTTGGVTSLYSKYLMGDGSISESQLVIYGVNSINYTFEIESNNSYQTKTLATMNNTDWKNIVQLTFNLELQAVDTQNSASPLIESLNQSIILGH